MRLQSALAPLLSSLLASSFFAQDRLLWRGGDHGLYVRDYQFSADGESALFRLGSPFAIPNLYSTRVDSIAPIRRLSLGCIQARPLASGYVLLLQLAPAGRTQLVRRAVDATGAVVDLAPDHSVERFLVSPDESRLVLIARPNEVYPYGRVYTVPSDGSAPPLEIGGGLSETRSTSLTPDAGQVLFEARVGSGPFGLWVAPCDGSRPPVALFNPLSSDAQLFGFLASAVGHALYLRLGPSHGRLELYSIPYDASAPAKKLSGAIAHVARETVSLSPDGTRVVFAAAQAGTGFGIYHAPADGSSARVLASSAAPWTDVLATTFTPDGTRLVYVADELENQRFELFSAPVDGSAAPIRLHGDLPAGGDVSWDFRADPSGRIVFRAELETDDVVELYSVPADGSASPVRLCAALTGPVARDVTNFQLDPSRARVLYFANEDSTDLELRAAPIDGSHASVRLSTVSPAELAQDSVAIDARAGRVLFGRYRDDGRLDLHVTTKGHLPAR